MAENTQNTTATTNEGEGKEKASGVKVPTVESKDLPEASKETPNDSVKETITESVTGVTQEEVQDIVKEILSHPEHIADAFEHNEGVEELYETSDKQVFLHKSDAMYHSRFLAVKTIKTYER